MATRNGGDTQEIAGREQRYGGTELDVNGGSVGCARFPNAKVTCETAHEPTVEGGVREVRTVVVEGLTAQEMLAPENRADAIDFMGRVAEAAGEMGFRFRDPEANAAAELLLRGEAAKARAAAMGAAEKGLVDAGQRLVDGLFGKESGIKVREGTAEEAAEVLGEASGKERFSVEIVDGKETAVANGYPLPIRDARNPEKVLQILSRLVGRSAAQIGEVKLSRIAYKTIKHLVNSEHARSDRTENGREAKKLWRGTVAGMSVVDDMVTTSQLGTAENAHHLNEDWKNTAKFYRAETRFAVETESGKYEVYPCELVVAEMRNGERIVYDITEIGTPTLSAAASQKGSTVGVPQRGATAHGGVGATPNSISQSGGGTQEGKMGKMPLRDEAGQVKGWWNREKGEVVLMKGADIRTVAHEIGWHAVRQWAEKNSPELLAKMNEYAASCPKSLRRLIEKRYKGFTGEALIDEIGAGRFERELGDEFRKLLETRPQVRSWWQKVTDAIRKMLRGFIGKGDGIDLKKMKKMSPEEAMKWLAGQMMEGKGLAERSSASGTGKRPAIAGESGARNMGIKGAGEAKAMEEAGAEREEIWRKTGWWKGKDGKWRFELPKIKQYKAVKLRIIEGEGFGATVGELVDSPDLFAAYPEVAKIPVVVNSMMNAEGSLTKRNGKYVIEISPSGYIGSGDGKNELSIAGEHTLVHEIQHAIQEREGFAKGGSPESASALVKDMKHKQRIWTYKLEVEETAKELGTKNPYEIEKAILEKLGVTNREQIAGLVEEGWIPDQAGRDKGYNLFARGYDKEGYEEAYNEYLGEMRKNGKASWWDGSPQKLYERLAGEVEARNASRREAMSPEERAATPPWETEDVPENRQIKRFSLKTGTVAEYTWATLTAKPDMKLTQIDPEKFKNYTKDSERIEDARRSIVEAGGRIVGKEAVIEIEGSEVIVGANGIKHRGRRRNNENDMLFPVLGEVMKNAVRVNELEPRAEEKGKKENGKSKKDDKVTDVFVYLGAFAYGNEVCPVRIQISQYEGVKKLDRIDVLKSLNTKIGRFASPANTDFGLVGHVGSGPVVHLPEISIANLMSIAQQLHPEIFSRDVAANLGVAYKGDKINARFSLEGREGAETRREGAEKALKGLLNGRRRVIEPVNPGAEERGEAGQAAGIEYEADVQVPEMSPSEDPSVAQPVAMGVSELSRMYRAITGHMFKVKGKSSTWNNARHGTWKNGKAWLAADVFGIVDKSDLEAIKEDLRKEGKFRHEDPQWAATHTKKQIEEMRDVSEMMLEDRITTLADDRVHGKRPGGNRSAINAMAHEIGRLVCEMPVDAGAPQRLKDMHTLGKGIVDALAKDPELRKEAEAAAKWWRIETHGVGAPCETEGSGVRDSLPLPGRDRVKGAPRPSGIGGWLLVVDCWTLTPSALAHLQRAHRAAQRQFADAPADDGRTERVARREHGAFRFQDVAHRAAAGLHEQIVRVHAHLGGLEGFDLVFVERAGCDEIAVAGANFVLDVVFGFFVGAAALVEIDLRPTIGVAFAPAIPGQVDPQARKGRFRTAVGTVLATLLVDFAAAFQGDIGIERIGGNLDGAFAVRHVAARHGEIGATDEGDVERGRFIGEVRQRVWLFGGKRGHVAFQSGEFLVRERHGGFGSQPEHDLEGVQRILVALLLGDDRLAGGQQVRLGLVDLDAIHAPGLEHHLGTIPVLFETAGVVVRVAAVLGIFQHLVVGPGDGQRVCLPVARKGEERVGEVAFGLGERFAHDVAPRTA